MKIAQFHRREGRKEGRRQIQKAIEGVDDRLTNVDYSSPFATAAAAEQSRTGQPTLNRIRKLWNFQLGGRRSPIYRQCGDDIPSMAVPHSIGDAGGQGFSDWRFVYRKQAPLTRARCKSPVLLGVPSVDVIIQSNGDNRAPPPPPSPPLRAEFAF